MWDIIIIGAGASGLMCSIEAAKRGRSVLILDHGKRAGQKIIMSGGGRCNFTNLYVESNNYLCDNPHFVKSALSRYTQWDFIALVDKHKISWHEREHGQLFCDESSKEILQLLLDEAKELGVKIELNTEIVKTYQDEISKIFHLLTSKGEFSSNSLVVATGGLSLPKIGASPFALKIAEQFKIAVKPTRAGLVPFTLHQEQKEKLAELSGISFPATASIQSKKAKSITFSEALLFTHRGLSGPVILQISNYWKPDDKVSLNLLPMHDLFIELKNIQKNSPEKGLKTSLSQFLPKRIIECFLCLNAIESLPLKQYNDKEFEKIAMAFHAWEPQINGTEGYRTAEVTLGGVDTDAISSKTFECKNVTNLYFIGESLDVTGWLGGFNFQWAWSSGWAAGQVV